MTRSRRLLLLLLSPVLILALVWGVAALRFPSDHTVEGAYFRVVIAVNRDQPTELFPYTETEAQHACYTIGKYRKQAKERVLASFPEHEKARVLSTLEPFADHFDGPDVFAIYAKQQGFIAQLRRDLSGIDHIEQAGERATVQTVKGTRYPFRLRDNGMWGLTLFTAMLVGEAERAARDAELIRKAADDYDIAR